MTTQFALNLPERRTRYRFALTPLADAMFQLLIFFMLSSGLSAYALLDLQTGTPPSEATAGAETGNAPDTAPSSATTNAALWTVEANALRVGGQRFGFDALDDLASALGAQETRGAVVLIVRPSAQVQDIAAVLASLTAANVTSVQITAGRSF